MISATSDGRPKQILFCLAIETMAKAAKKVVAKRKKKTADLEVTFTPLFQQVASGEIAISGMQEGICYVHETLLPRIMRMSFEGRLWPYQIITACIVKEHPQNWFLVVKEIE